MARSLVEVRAREEEVAREWGATRRAEQGRARAGRRRRNTCVPAAAAPGRRGRPAPR